MSPKSQMKQLGRSIIVLGITGIACLGASAGSIAIWCQVLNHTPRIPVYPNAKLINETNSLIYYAHSDQYYLSSDSPDKIIEFYQPQMFREGYQPNTPCPDATLAGECFGNATLFGKYYVYVDRDSFTSNKETKFTIEIQWKTCSWDIR